MLISGQADSSKIEENLLGDLSTIEEDAETINEEEDLIENSNATKQIFETSSNTRKVYIIYIKSIGI